MVPGEILKSVLLRHKEDEKFIQIFSSRGFVVDKFFVTFAAKNLSDCCQGSSEAVSLVNGQAPPKAWQPQFWFIMQSNLRASLPPNGDGQNSL